MVGPPNPFDIVLPQLTRIIENSNNGVTTNGVKTFVFNTQNYGQEGFHWVTISILVD